MRGATAEAGVRDLRDFLAGAFQLPADATLPAEENSPDNDRSTPESSHSKAFTPTSANTPERSVRTPETSARTPDRTEHPSATAPESAPFDPTAFPFPAPDSTLIPATPRTPTSMASPSRDSDLRRTFPAFSPRPSGGDARFAETWWGNAWVTALEKGALDAKRLARGRGYAEKGHVDAITVTPGLVLAYVQGSRARPYRVQVRLRTLDDGDWERFLDTAADRPGHIAALLDKEMPKSLAESGVPLLPGPGDLDPHCSCPDSGHPCKHAAALCYQTARLLDADPFVLLLLRGRGERPLLDALSRRNAARAARAAQEQEPAPLPGMRATEALAQRRLPPLPPPLPAPPHPEQPPVYPAAPGGPDPFALDQLATDAAARAYALLSTGRDPVGDLTLWQDAVRLAAARPGSGLTAATRSLYASLARATGRSTAELARAVAAWRQGGLEGLAVLEEPWDPPAGRFDRARPLLLAADLPAFRPWHNHLSHPRGHVQLRLGRDGLWYAYESEPGHEDWWPRGTPDLDPVGALTGLGSPSEL
nr:SWIM zinc finger family protein [Streptomyces sp. NBC_00886]